MPAKKKKKSGKLAKMTEEERIAYEDQKRLAEEEMRKKKEDMLAQFMKDKLTKEEKASKFNLNKLNHQWRNIMREAKSRELKKDIEILSQTFERVVDRKDAVIKSLAKDIMEAEEQYSMALRSHLQNVDNLIGLQRQRLGKAKHEYTEELDIIMEEFDSEREMLVEQHTQEMTDIDDILFAMDQNFQEAENEAKSEFQSMRDEIKNKNLEEKHALRVVLESKVDDLWQQFRQALQNYNETTEERKTAFETLKAKDEKSAREIELQMRKLQRISDQISGLKGKMSSNSKECEERNRSLKEERERMLAHFQDLKAQMNKLRDAERDKLTKLTLESNAAIKEIKRQKEKAEQIMRLAEMCRKVETEEEKVLPFYASSLTAEEIEDVDAAILEPPSEPLALVIHEYSSLENFWKRHNKVLLDKLALDKEKQTLVQENQQLRTLLKQYLDGISVNDEILSQVNPLFIVNNKTNVKLNVPVVDPRVRRPPPQTVVEAAHIIKHILPS
ncbi:dynein regulatory complex subunit 2-like [Haliotis rufescens]|uniref:dynein regulatory complex subunit 2-like n=1 Tax=Haliotis rufescens TaxID=6454 RepID=UPI00201E88A0|nr:dynein regulatory complex subunit 2-like [Haliotis rufescens]XP_048252417.1 dynein regulatory complex subunit 2-like [Haliotis rufescens]XP_048252418.1 dynein regulatory complex subunit 2-like [Haliotis rufescens]